METNMSCVGLGASLLQARDRMQFLRNEAHDNAELWLIAFAGKSLKSAEIPNIPQKEETRHIISPRKIPLLLLCHEVNMIIDHKLLVAIFKKHVVSL